MPVTKRNPSPPLLRAQRRWTLHSILPLLALFLAGVLCGVLLGIGVRPRAGAELAGLGTTAPHPAGEAPPPATAPPEAQAEVADLTAHIGALQEAAAQERARLDALALARDAAEAEQKARLDSIARARAAAEAQLAALQRDVAAAQAAQREIAATPPPPPPPPRRETVTPTPAPAPTPLAPAAAPTPRPARPETATGQPRVFIHHRAGSPAGAEAASALAEAVRGGGFEVPDVRPSPSVPSQRAVRYFHAEDAAAAARLAGRLGRGWAIQDFRGFDPAPAPGTLEVWVPDR